MDKIVVITGPTAVGKTKLSLGVAQHFNTEIINADAFQIYKQMNIGTAKPTPAEQAMVKHHLIDIIEPGCEFSIAEYQKRVRLIIDQMLKEHKLPILVGGSGLYINSVIKDYHFDSAMRDEQKFADLSNEALHELLASLDQSAADKIHQNNRKRLIRAIELAQSPSFKNSTAPSPYFYDVLCIFLSDDREALYDRINKRVDQMIENGLVEEVKKIGLNNFSTTSKVAIGYKELIAYLNQEISFTDAVDLIKKNSRHYAKRQYTWFKNQTDSVIVKINPDDFKQTIDEVINLINNFLKLE